MADLDERFESAQEAVTRLPARPDDETLLELYSYFKQATEGDVAAGRGPLSSSRGPSTTPGRRTRASRETPLCGPTSSSWSICSRCKVREFGVGSARRPTLDISNARRKSHVLALRTGTMDVRKGGPLGGPRKGSSTGALPARKR